MPLGGLDPRDFLDRHWQKSPLLIRGAFPGFRSPIDGDELAGLSCEREVESRIVRTGPGPTYTLQNGPFSESDFAALGERDWTLLVQDVEKHVPELAVILDEFDFLPSWRIDDLMISWAADGGSVGPHVDGYDVFLLQAEGRRRWKVGREGADPTLLPDRELKVLARFETVDEWLLEPGDMLYLPPGIPHWGIAEGACMTWSVGFRAPSHREWFAEFADRITEGLPDSLRYADPDLGLEEAVAGAISPAAIRRASEVLDAAWMRGRHDLPRWFGEAVTAPKAWLHCEPVDDPPDAGTLRGRLASGASLVRDSRARLAWSPLPERGLCLFADGHSIELPSRLGTLLGELCSRRRFPPGSLKRYLEDEDAMRALVWLVAGGQLLEEEDD